MNQPKDDSETGGFPRLSVAGTALRMAALALICPLIFGLQRYGKIGVAPFDARLFALSFVWFAFLGVIGGACFAVLQSMLPFTRVGRAVCGGLAGTLVGAVALVAKSLGMPVAVGLLFSVLAFAILGVSISQFGLPEPADSASESAG